MSASTSAVAWAWFEILAGIGIGFPLTTQLPAIQAVLRESDTTISTSTYSELNGQVLEQTLNVYREALCTVWFVGLAFALMGFLWVFAEKHVDMRVTLETEFGLEAEKKPEKALVTEVV
ncbi:hypothetical protein Daesc_006987 [Daldinia eschscholtzii]|uniref:Uncharacterized protein n=1 Tax=Daldinia eschscholtzii TaxID=292717 RepID=A0AAX6MIH3_9PEZI